MSGGPGIDLSIGPPEPAEAPPRDFVTPEPKKGAGGVAMPTIELADPEQIRGLLNALGLGAGYMLRDPDVPGHWRFTDDELDSLAPPLARIVNRTPKLLEAVKRGDEITVGITLAGYLGRNVQAGSAARKAREEDTDGQPHEAGNDFGPGLGGPRSAAQPGPPAPAGDTRRLDPTNGRGPIPGPGQV